MVAALCLDYKLRIRDDQQGVLDWSFYKHVVVYFRSDMSMALTDEKIPCLPVPVYCFTYPPPCYSLLFCL
jgi:hypothetical protein